MNCPECDGDVDLLLGGDHFSHVTGYVCEECGLVSDVTGRHHPDRSRERAERPDDRVPDGSGFLDRLADFLPRSGRARR